MEDYLGTLSAIPTRKPVAVVPTSPKRERGKVRGNRRNPRTRTIAISDCKVYKDQEAYEAGEVSRTISRSAGTRKRQAKDRALVQQVHRLSSADLPALQNYETDA